jgi:hypothetical protein
METASRQCRLDFTVSIIREYVPFKVSGKSSSAFSIASLL